MAFQSKTPPIKLIIDNNFYNLMLEILTRNEKVENLSVGEKSKKLKEKLLKYSIPFESEKEESLTKVGFFNSEATEMIQQLLVYLALNEKLEITTNYYSVLLKLREENKKFKEG